MKIFDVTDIITKALADTKLVEAIFLKGSIASKDYDEYSNIDLYCLVSSNHRQQFLDVKYDVLEKYRSILYMSEILENKQICCMQIICIYEDGLRLNLYVDVAPFLSSREDIEILYDPHQILKNYKLSNIIIEEKEIAEIINQFSLLSHEYYIAIKRKDICQTVFLYGKMHNFYIAFQRYLVDTKHFNMGNKRFFDFVTKEYFKKQIMILKLLKYDTSVQAVQIMFNDIYEMLGQMPITFVSELNYDFFVFIMKLIFSL